jgi:hypothetical protein
MWCKRIYLHRGGRVSVQPIAQIENSGSSPLRSLFPRTSKQLYRPRSDLTRSVRLTVGTTIREGCRRRISICAPL